MASLSHPCRWMLLGDLRVRCNGMSDLSFTRGLWRAEAEGLLEHSYSSQSYRFLSRLKSPRFTSMISRAITDVSQCLLITVHYLPFNILLGDIKRCLRTTQLAPAVRDVFLAFSSSTRNLSAWKRCALLLKSRDLFPCLRKAFRRNLQSSRVLEFASTPMPGNVRFKKSAPHWLES